MAKDNPGSTEKYEGDENHRPMSPAEESPHPPKNERDDEEKDD